MTPETPLLQTTNSKDLSFQLFALSFSPPKWNCGARSAALVGDASSRQRMKSDASITAIVSALSGSRCCSCDLFYKALYASFWVAPDDPFDTISETPLMPYAAVPSVLSGWSLVTNVERSMTSSAKLARPGISRISRVRMAAPRLWPSQFLNSIAMRESRPRSASGLWMSN